MTLVIGHRGAMGSCAENTLACFERAAALGADCVELDVRQSRDGALVVVHDETLDRTTSTSGRVADYDAAELRRLDVPTLDEVLDWARERRIGVDIELKKAPPRQVVDAVRRAAMADRVLISGFDHPLVRQVKSLDPRLTIGLLYAHRAIDAVRLAREADAQWLLPHWSYVVAEDVQAAHAAGLRVGTWATSEPAVLRSLIAAGVDAICTDHPDILRRVLDGGID